MQIERYRADGVLSVEMEAAALMALGKVREVSTASLLHVTNTLAASDKDFLKGPDDINERILGCCLATFREALGRACG